MQTVSIIVPCQVDIVLYTTYYCSLPLGDGAYHVFALDIQQL